jgi:hypothetical protein
MQMDSRDEQRAKTHEVIPRSLDPDSNDTDDVEMHEAKQLAPIVLTEAGITND